MDIMFIWYYEIYIPHAVVILDHNSINKRLLFLRVKKTILYLSYINRHERIVNTVYSSRHDVVSIMYTTRCNTTSLDHSIR